MEIPIYKKTQVLKLIETPIHTVYDFMHQRMILFVLYGLFHKFHAKMSHFLQFRRIFLPNRKYRKYRVIIVSKPKILCNIVWTLKKDIVAGWSRADDELMAPLPLRGYYFDERPSCKTLDL